MNSTKPLPKGLIHELLPTTRGELPKVLQLRRFPAYLLERLNYENESPLQHLIHTPTTPEGVIKDNSVFRMLENSLSDGSLYRFRDPETGEGDTESMLSILMDYWGSCPRCISGCLGSSSSQISPDAWCRCSQYGLCDGCDR